MKRKVWIGAGLIVAAIAWYAFRPELLFVNKSVSESFPASVAANSTEPASNPMQLATGQFKGYAHETQGNAGIYEVDGKRVLRLTNFKTSNGPDVHVYLVAAPDVKDEATVKNAGFIDLGSMKGNMGDQNYDVPDTADLRKYQAVSIWCARFNVNFGSAPLARTMPSAPKPLARGQFKGYAHETEGTAAVFDVHGFSSHLMEAGLGHVSEIFDGDFPHVPRGCFAQAWSVAELLRAVVENGLSRTPAKQTAAVAQT